MYNLLRSLNHHHRGKPSRARKDQATRARSETPAESDDTETLPVLEWPKIRRRRRTGLEMYQTTAEDVPKLEWKTFNDKFLPDLGGWRRSCAQVYRELSEAEREEYERAAEEWNAQRDGGHADTAGDERVQRPRP